MSSTGRYTGQADRGGLDIPPMVDCPGGCGATVQMDIETDGDGDLVELIEPCPKCRPTAFRPPAGQRLDRCKRCGSPFSQPIKRGRPRTLCPRCAS